MATILAVGEGRNARHGHCQMSGRHVPGAQQRKGRAVETIQSGQSEDPRVAGGGGFALFPLAMGNCLTLFSRATYTGGLGRVPRPVWSLGGLRRGWHFGAGSAARRTVAGWKVAHVTLVGKILTVSIFLLSVMFLGFSVMNFATSRDYRSRIKGNGSAPGLETRLNETTRLVLEREDELQRARYRIDLETAARRSALSVLERKAVLVTQRLDRVEGEYVDLAKLQRERNENVKAVQDEVSRLIDEVERVRGELTAAISRRDTELGEITKLVDKLNEDEGALRRLRERSRQLAGVRGR